MRTCRAGGASGRSRRDWWTIACSFRAWWYGMRSGASTLSCRSAWPMPATLPWPKIPNTPGNRPLTDVAVHRPLAREELDERLAHRHPLRRGHRCSLSSSREWQTRVDALGGPRVAHPRVRRIIADQPHALGVGPGHHVQVVQVVPGRRDGGTMIAVRDERDVARPDGRIDLDLARRRGVGAEHAEGADGGAAARRREPEPTRSSRSPRGGTRAPERARRACAEGTTTSSTPA